MKSSMNFRSEWTASEDPEDESGIMMLSLNDKGTEIEIALPSFLKYTRLTALIERIEIAAETRGKLIVERKVERALRGSQS